jgi:hypothetical protein
MQLSKRFGVSSANLSHKGCVLANRDAEAIDVGIVFVLRGESITVQNLLTQMRVVQMRQPDQIGLARQQVVNRKSLFGNPPIMQTHQIDDGNLRMPGSHVTIFRRRNGNRSRQFSEQFIERLKESTDRQLPRVAR